VLISSVAAPIPYILIEEFFTKEEYEDVFSESECLRKANLLMPPGRTSSAKNVFGDYIKKNSGAWIGDLYGNSTDQSAIIKSTRKIFTDVTLQNQMRSHPSWYFNQCLFYESQIDHTLLSYYDNFCHYHAHRDSCEFTCLVWFFKEPRVFSGGNLILGKSDATIELRNNLGIIFPGSCLHAVDIVKMEEQYQGQGLGRYALSIFVNTRP